MVKSTEENMSTFEFSALLLAWGCVCLLQSPGTEAAPLSRPSTSQLSTAARARASFNCELCKLTSGVLELVLEANSTEEEIMKVITDYCVFAKIEDERVCSAAIEEFRVRAEFIAP